MVKLCGLVAVVTCLCYAAEALPFSTNGQHDKEVTGSARLLRTDQASSGGQRRKLNEVFWSNVWTAAVADSQTTSTVDGKCRLPDGRVVPIGTHHLYKGKGSYHYYDDDDCGPKGKSKGKGKGKSSSSGSKSSKGKGKSGKSRKTCAPTVVPTASPTSSPTESQSPTESAAPTDSQAPTAAPTESFTPTVEPTHLPTHSPTKDRSSSSSKGKTKKSMSTKSTMSMKKSSKGSKSSKAGNSKSKGRYEDMDLPYCSDLTHSPTKAPTNTPTLEPTTTNERETCQAIIDGSGVDKWKGDDPKRQVKVLIVLVGTFTSDDPFIARLKAGMRSLLAIASGCNVNFSFGDRRRLDGSSGDSPEAEMYLQNGDLGIVMKGDSACLTYNVGSGTHSCEVASTTVDMYKKGVTNLKEILNKYTMPFAQGMDGVEAVYFLTDDMPSGNGSDGDGSSSNGGGSSSNGGDGSTSGGDGSTSGGDGSTSGGGDSTAGGDSSDNDRGVAGATAPESVSSKEGVSTGGMIGVAGAGLLLLLLLLLLVRRGRNKDKDATRHFEVTDDDEANSNFMDEDEEEKVSYMDHDEFSDLGTNRLAHVVGEDDSQYTGNSWGNKSRIRIEPVRSVPEETFSQPVEVTPSGVPYEDQRLHDIGQTCSSPTCKICESRRQQGASTKFVRNQKYDPNPSETDRDYISSDTVDL